MGTVGLRYSRRKPCGSSGPAVSPSCAAVARIVLWTSAALIAWTQVVYGLFLAALRRFAPGLATSGAAASAAPEGGAAPRVSLIIAARLEEAVIADKIANALA